VTIQEETRGNFLLFSLRRGSLAWAKTTGSSPCSRMQH